MASTFLYIFISISVAALVVFFQYFYKDKTKNNLNLQLGLLRFISIFGIVLLFFNIGFQTTKTQLIKPDLFVVADNSESIRFQKQDSLLKQLFGKIKTDPTLNKRFNIESITFGKDIQISDNLTFNNAFTDIQNVLSKIDALSDNAVVILLTDGNQNTGKDYIYTKTKNKIYPVVMGDTTSFADLKIDRVNVNPFAFEGNRTQLEVFNQYEGNRPVDTELQIQLNYKVIYRKKIRFDKGKKSLRTEIKLPARKKGNYFYTAYLKPLQNEVNVQNNSFRFNIRVLSEKANILLLYSVLHPDVAVWKRMLEKNNQRKLTAFDIRNFKGNFNQYQWVILFQPDKQFKLVFEKIQKHKINFILQTGLRTDWPVLLAFQKTVTKVHLGNATTVFPELNPDFNLFQVNDPGFSDFPPLSEQSGKLMFYGKHYTMLYGKTAGSSGDKNAVLAITETANQRAAYLFGEGLYKWRSYFFANNDDFEHFDNVFEAVFQFLQHKNRRSAIDVDIEPYYFSSDPVRIRVGVYDANFNRDTIHIPELQVRYRDGRLVNNYTMYLKDGVFQTELPGLKPGIYDFTVTSTQTGEKKQGSFEVLPFNPEQQKMQSDYKSLQKLAALSGGAVSYPDDLSSLLENLKNNPEFKPVQKQTKNISPIINHKWILFIIVLSLSIEWFVRKYHGLV